MSAAESLITWDQAQSLGKIPNSEWLCPTSEDLSSLGEVHRMNGTVSEEDIRVFADGRDQHYELKQFPEGQYAVDIVDSKTGQVRTASHYALGYLGLSSCNCRKSFQEPIRGSWATDKSFPLPDGRWITMVAGINGITTGVATSPSESDTTINPSRRRFNLTLDGTFTSLDRGSTGIEVRQLGNKINTSLWFSQLAGEDYEEWKSSYVNLNLDSSGQVTSISARRKQILDNLGVTLDMDVTEDSQETGRSTTIVDPGAIARVTAGIAAILGWQQWTGIDLRHTTSQLYATMGKPDFDIVEAFTPR